MLRLLFFIYSKTEGFFSFAAATTVLSLILMFITTADPLDFLNQVKVSNLIFNVVYIYWGLALCVWLALRFFANQTYITVYRLKENGEWKYYNVTQVIRAPFNHSIRYGMMYASLASEHNVKDVDNLDLLFVRRVTLYHLYLFGFGKIGNPN